MEPNIPDFSDSDTIKFHISQIIEFLNNYKVLLRTHMTEAYLLNYISQIPDSWYEALIPFPYTDYLNIYSMISKIEEPSLLAFLSEACRLRPSFPIYTKSCEISFKETVGMTPKKIHETTRLSHFIHSCFSPRSISQIIDLGAGQGYLSFFLASRFDYQVTAIEGRLHNSEKSKQRAERISKSMPGENSLKNVCKIVQGEELENYSDSVCGIVGLHTCGDLASDSLKMFVNSENMKGIINVGCCYQLLSESVDKASEEYLEYVKQAGLGEGGRNLDESLVEDREKAGFPLSQFIRGSYPKFMLGKLTRSLCIGDSSEKNSEKAIENFIKMEYRAAFQYLLSTKYPNFSKVFAIGNKIKRFNDFAGYCDAAFRRLKLENPLDKRELNDFFDRTFKENSKKVSILWTIRSAFSGPVENLILLDRILYLKEQGMDVRAYSVFDRTISPRNTAIVAFKLH